MATDFSTLEIRADSRSVKTATTDLGKMGAASSKLGGTLRKLAPALAAVVSIRALGKMAGEAREFGAAMGEVNTLLSDTSQLERLNKEALALASTFGGSPTEQARGFYQAISAGAADAAAATEILTTANKLAIGGVTDVTTAVDGLTSIVNAFGLEASQAGTVSDALFVAMKAGKTTVGELSSSVGKLAPIASSVGLSMEEMLGAVSALTTQGISTSESVNGLKAALANVLKPTKEAGDEAERLGLNFGLAALQEKGFTGFMDSVVEKSGGSKESIVKLFGSVEALNTVFALTGGAAGKYADIMESMADKTGETDAAFGKIADTMDFKLEVLSGRMAAARIEVGAFFLGLAEPIVDGLNANFDTYKSFLVGLVDGASATARALALAFAPWGSAWNSLLQGMGQAFSMFSNFVGEKWDSLGIKGLKVSEFIAIGFGNMLSGVKAAIETSTIQVASFFDKVGFWAKWSVGLANDSGDELLAIDMARTKSLEAVENSYRASNAALADSLMEARLADAGFTLLDQTVYNLDGTTKDFAAGIGELAIVQGEAAASADDVTEALGGVIGTTGMSGALETSDTALESHRTMVENVQSAWEDLAFDFLDKGKLNFKSFFDSVLDGYKRLVAGLIAEKLTNAVFGNTGLGGFASSLVGGGGGGAGGSLLSSAVTGSGGAGLLSSAVATGGQFVAGLTGSATGIAAGTVGPPTAAAFAGQGIGASLTAGLAAIPVWGWALLAAGAAAAIFNNDDGKVRENAGFMVAPTPALAGSDRAFDVDSFSSGLNVTGFARRVDKSKAIEVIDTFRDIDLAMFDMVKELGGNLDLSKATLAGLDQEATPGSDGTFLGLGGNGGLGGDIDAQIDMFVAQLANHVGGLDDTIMQQIKSAKSSDEVFTILAAEIALLDTSNESLEESNTLLADSVDSLTKAFTRPAESSPLRLTGQTTMDTELSEGAQDFFGASGESLSFKESQRRERVIRNLARVEQGYNPLTGKYDGPITDGSHAGGLDRVPFDGYVAELHQGERVLTAKESSEMDSGARPTGGVAGMVFSILSQIIKAVNIIRRWDANGLPAERT